MSAIAMIACASNRPPAFISLIETASAASRRTTSIMSRRSKQLSSASTGVSSAAVSCAMTSRFAWHRLLDEGRRELLDVAQDLDGAERRQRLIVVDAKIDLVAKLFPDRCEMIEILAMRLHAGFDLVDDVAVWNHFPHSFEIG